MRIKILRSFGKNMPVATAEEGEAVKTAMDKDPPFLEGQVREMSDAGANYLIRNGLAEETTEDLTELPVHAKAKAKAATAADDLDSKTVVELHDIARKEAINLQGVTAKDDIVKAIRKDRKKP